MNELKKDALESLREYLECSPDTDKDDAIREVADSSVPVYSYDLLQLAANNPYLGVDEPECGPAFDGSATPVNIIAANAYEDIINYLYEHVEDLVAK